MHSGASENLIRTYIVLGRHAPTARLVESEPFVACTGEVEHAICNFAMRLRLNDEALEALREMASGKRVFNVYSLPEDQPENIGEVLGRAGFRKTYSLVQMEGVPKDASDDLRVEQASDAKDRRTIARFMVEQFFGAQPARVRDAVTQATAAAVRFQLYPCFERGKLVGAAMAHRAAGYWGLYNLCVRPDFQNRGFGAAIVKAIGLKARDSNLPMTLQCDRNLEDWYQKLGFRRTGTIQVFGLSNRGNDVIMK
jgi:predicted GNAT family acetyltransferase